MIENTELNKAVGELTEVIESKFGAKMEELTKHNVDRMAKIEEELRLTKTVAEKSEAVASLGDMLSVASEALVKKANPFDYAKKMGRNDVVKTMELQNYDEAGFLYTPNYSNDFIKLLYSKVAVMNFNPQVVPLNGTLTFKKQTAGSTFTWVDETEERPKTEVKGGNITLKEKNIGGVIPYSRTLANASALTSQLIMSDITSSMAQTLDKAYLEGTGTDHTPRGLVSWANSTSNTFTMASSIITSTINDLTKLMKAIELADVPMESLGWVINPRDKYWLRTLENTGGFYYWQQSIDSGVLFGVPYISTNNMTHSTTHNILLAAFNQVIIGQGNMFIRVSEEGSYNDGTEVRSLMQHNEIGIFVNYSTDLICRHDKAVSVLQSVTYGA
jgi:HK97 family phage major capsid protein